MNTSSLFSFLVETAIKASALLGVAWIAALMLRKSSAALRHFVWTLAFAAVLTLPLLSLALPSLSLPIADAPSVIFRTTAQANAPQFHGDNRPSAKPAELQKSQNGLTDWRIALLLIWLVGVSISFTQMLIGWVAIARLRREARPLQFEDVPLLETTSGIMPMACGLFHPAILLPSDAKNWKPERLRMVLLHEMAHVRRRDVATHLLARTALCFYWWNPLAWNGWREFVKERERAADDMVLSAGECGSTYASHLLEIARSMKSAWAWSAVSMASRSQLEGRLLSILDSTRNRYSPRRSALVAGALAVFALLVPVAAVHAQSDSSLMQAGDAARDKGKFDEAKALYTKALTTASNPSAALIDRGVVELTTKDYPAALADFELAQKEDQTRSGRAFMWQAVAQQAQDNSPAALILYQKALDEADPQSMTAAVTMELYATLLDQMGQSGDAVKLRQQSREIRVAQAKLAVSATEVSTGPVYRAGQGVKSPVLKSKVEPQYSAEARAARYSGTVLLKVEIGPDGLTRNVQIVRPLGLGLDEKAVQAVNQWTFQAGVKDGQPVTVAATIEVKFRLM